MSKVLVVAEIGVNHNGNIDIAEKMIKVAKQSGADVVKFQTGIPERGISKFAEKADYQKNNTKSSESQLEMCKKLQLSFENYRYLWHVCDREGIAFCSTPFDLESIEFLKSLDMPFWKIPSGEITNLPYLIKIAQIGKPIILSSGMSTLDELRTTLNVLKKNIVEDITVLHCTTEYPAPFEDVNLLAMLSIRDELKVKIGYSDHTLGIEVAIAAITLGACVIEKHFTLDKNMDGPDHKASLEPDELTGMVNAIRNIEKAMGSGKKVPSPSERKNIDIARKSIVANRYIHKGERFTVENITTKRPGNGISPMCWFEVIGTLAIKDFVEDELIIL